MWQLSLIVFSFFYNRKICWVRETCVYRHTILLLHWAKWTLYRRRIARFQSAVLKPIWKAGSSISYHSYMYGVSYHSSLIQASALRSTSRPTTMSRCNNNNSKATRILTNLPTIHPEWHRDNLELSFHLFVTHYILKWDLHCYYNKSFLKFVYSSCKLRVHFTTSWLGFIKRTCCFLNDTKPLLALHISPMSGRILNIV